MKKRFTIFLVMIVFIPFLGFTQNCVDFESLTLGTEYGDGYNLIGDIIFTENDIPVSVEYFEWLGGGGTFGNCQVIDGAATFGTPQAMWTSNINLKFDFSNLAVIPNWITFDFLDQGGEENISVNGAPIFVGELNMAPMPPGISIAISNMGAFQRATLSGPITSLLVGGQEFSLDNICTKFVVDTSDCVNFDLLPLGAEYGDGYNAIGDMIFTENDIPVTVEYFEWIGGGGTFGNCQVIDGDAFFGTGQAMWTSNINLGFDFNNLEVTPNWITFDFVDQGGEENISVNGSSIFVGDIEAAVLPSGITMFITDMGTYMQATLVGQVPITEFLIGGQEFMLDNICPTYVSFDSWCVDFETLSLGDMFGTGINSPGEVIFTQNGIPVAVDNFNQIGGGITFGFAEVTTGSGIGTGLDMRTGNINLMFDFAAIDITPDFVTFDFADYGGYENLALNGGAVYVGDLIAAPTPAGFSMNVSMSGDIGHVIIEGPVEKLLVGGQEFFLDNICAYQIITSIEDPVGYTAGTGIILGQNYPNPFNGSTVIPFELSEDTYVVISIYDHLGREVAVLANAEYESGRHSVNWDGNNAVNGIYFYQLRTPRSSVTKKMSLYR
ncbi:MAG: T9SS type A sorting domain-containing protein [Bacteroidetes bacterium]|nr:T9SS type A sorting domain-containing protein [Bacteroidota bacterium]